VINRDPEMKVAVLSEKGRRDENQDWMSWSRVDPWGELFIIADGMGGHKGGALAARMTVEGLEKHIRDLPAEWPFVKAFQEAFRKTNEEVYRSAHSGNPETENMGSTLVAALISDGKVQVGHIGDSRAYLFRKGKLRPLTKDHTTVQRMLDAGMITAEEARKHPEAHVLSRAVGSKPEVEIEIGEPVKLEEGDALMMCSDGLTGYVDDQQIEKVLGSQSSVQSIPQDLADLALKASGDDNITVQFIRYGETVTVTETARTTARLPISQRPDPATGIWEALERLSKNRLAWAVAAVALMLSGAVVAVILNYPWTRDRSGAMVTPAPPPPPTTIDPKATPQKIKSGEAVTLTWKTQNANTVRIEPGVGDVPVNGSKSVTPTESVSYVFTATGPGGTIKTVVDVKVILAGPGGPQSTTVESPVVPTTVPPPSKKVENTKSKIEAKEQATVPSATTKAINVDASKEAIPVLILARTKEDLADAEAIKQRIKVSYPKTSVDTGEVELLPSSNDRCRTSAFIYYPDKDLKPSSLELAAALMKEKGLKGLEKIDECRDTYNQKKKLQSFAEEKLSGQKRHLLIVLPPRPQ